MKTNNGQYLPVKRHWSQSGKESKTSVARRIKRLQKVERQIPDCTTDRKFYTQMDDEQIRTQSFYFRNVLSKVNCLLPNLFVLEAKRLHPACFDGQENKSGLYVRYICSVDGVRYKEMWEVFMTTSPTLDIIDLDLDSDNPAITLLYDIDEFNKVNKNALIDADGKWQKTCDKHNDEPLLCIQDYPSCIVYEVE